jgi:hypothetical protein
MKCCSLSSHPGPALLRQNEIFILTKKKLPLSAKMRSIEDETNPALFPPPKGTVVIKIGNNNEIEPFYHCKQTTNAIFTTREKITKMLKKGCFLKEINV